MDNRQNNRASDYVPPTSPEPGSIQAMIADEVNSQVTRQIAQSANYMVRSAVMSTMVTAATALRKQMYQLAPVAADEFLVPPALLIIEDPEEHGFEHHGVILSKRFFVEPHAFLLTVLYSEDSRYHAAVSTFNEDALDRNSTVVLPKAIMNEINRQLRSIEPRKAGQIAHFGLFIRSNFFGATAAPTDEAPAAQQPEQMVQTQAPVPEQIQTPAPVEKLQLPAFRAKASTVMTGTPIANNKVDGMGLPVR